MRLSKRTRDAVKVAAHLAHCGDVLQSIPQIAEACDITGANTFKLIPLMVRAGFLETERGRGGGVRLARSPGEITVGSIVRAMEKIERSSPEGDDDFVGDLEHILDDAFEGFLEILDQNTLADLGSGKAPTKLLSDSEAKEA